MDSHLPSKVDSLGRSLKELAHLPYPVYTKEELSLLHDILKEEIAVPGKPGGFYFSYDHTIFNSQENFVRYLDHGKTPVWPLLHTPYKDLPLNMVEKKSSFSNALYRSIIRWRLQLGV